MQIKTIADFMKCIGLYFGGFPNAFVQDLYAEELSYIKPGDYNQLFQYIIGHNPASWKPDVKAIKDGIIALKINTLSLPGREKSCQVCATKWSTTGICPVCNYDPQVDGTPDEHRAWYENWKKGLEPKYDISGMLSGLTRQHNVGKD
jgi:hypothetical protein